MNRKIALLLPVLCMPVAYAEDVKVPPTPGSVEHASADDCAIIVEIGKAQMGWGGEAPDHDFFTTFDKKGGAYIEDCAWTDFGVADPVIGTPESTRGFYISRPVYTGSQATADLNQMIRAPARADGTKVAPFMESDRCTLEKRDGHWHIVKCEMRYIT